MTKPSPIAQLRAMLAQGPDPTSLTIAQQREGVEQVVTLNPPASDVSASADKIAGIPCEWVSTPASRKDTVVYYTHGGAYVTGSPRSHRAIMGELARSAGARVLAVDYRLAPEHPFPAAIEDALAVYEAIASAGNVKRLAIAGDSAGGGLAVATLISARERGLRMADAAALFSPWTDLACTGHSYQSKLNADPVVHPQVSRTMAALYLGKAHAKNPYASPLYGDLSQLPPMLIQVGSCEILLDDALMFERRARESGIDVSLEVWPEMVHVWHAFTAILPQAKAALQRAGEYLQQQWNA